MYMYILYTCTYNIYYIHIYVYDMYIYNTYVYAFGLFPKIIPAVFFFSLIDNKDKEWHGRCGERKGDDVTRHLPSSTVIYSSAIHQRDSRTPTSGGTTYIYKTRFQIYFGIFVLQFLLNCQMNYLPRRVYTSSPFSALLKKKTTS